MASRPLSSFRTERYALDLPVAALAGLAVAFAAFAVPSEVLAELIGVTGLPQVLPAAQPPLGTTARIALAAGGALTVFALAFLLLRWLDRFAASAPAARPAPAEGPRLRKRDGHPDAPAVRPISAIREFGEPASPLAVKRKPEAAEPVEFPEPSAPPALAEPTAPAAVAEPAAPAAPAARIMPAASAEPIRPPSLAELMARLEKGLAERRSEPEADTLAPPAPQAFPEAGDDRLQSAIENLQRLASRDR
jgi:hypothetical protein